MTALASADTVLDRLKGVVGQKGWIDDPGEVEPYLVESRGLYRGGTHLVLRPRSTEEVAEIVRLCAAARLVHYAGRRP